MLRVRDFWKILKEAGNGFVQHNVFKLSASLCFYAIFSIGPVMLVIIFITGIFFSQEAIEGTIFNQINGIIGKEAALQVQELIRNTSLSSNNNIMAILGFALLLFSATAVFTEIQESMNSIWNVQVKKHKNWQQIIKNRLVSFIMITGLGLFLILLLIIDGLLEGLMDKFLAMFPRIALNMVYAANLLLTLLIVSILFAFIYKIMPDINFKWKYALVGAFFSAILFMIGKFGLTFYLSTSKMSSTYSSAGSLIILLSWIYYSATILYFGAEFTKAYARKYSTSIMPKSYAVNIKIITIEN